MSESSGERFAILQPFPAEWQGERAEQVRTAALAHWHHRATAAGLVLGKPVAERVDPVEVDGVPLTFTYEDEDGSEVELPPVSAWRVEGLVLR